ncbi:MAG: hypothetical protein QNK04_23630 [Myxococcota bacterium]|nr:hypothetical protein [Myxococcota bacterium]
MGILERVKSWLGLGPKPPREFSQEEAERHYEAKKVALENVLGPMHDVVGHALIPFEIGGPTDT